MSTWDPNKIKALTGYLNSPNFHDGTENASLIELESALKDVLGLNNKAKSQKPK